MTKPQNILTLKHPSTLIVGIQAPYNKTSNIQAYYDEFLNLLKTCGITHDKALFIKLNTVDPKTFLTTGKLEELDDLCQKNSFENIYISEPLTAKQARNLEDYLHRTILDRTDLILDIFKKAAISAEGKAQVEIAMLEHEKTRLAGKGIFLSQQRGGISIGGATIKSGPGETLKEREKRFFNVKIQQIKKLLESLKTKRDTQRKQRIQSGTPQICLIGYTNAGKSTILNTLTKAQVLAEDRLFATLDTTTRELFIDGKKKGLLSDTVGFIQYLPHNLIEAFKSTLSELQYADLLLQVIDCSDIDWQSHIAVVHEILDELGVQKPLLYVFNKIDKLNPEAQEEFKTAAQHFQPHVFIQATNKIGIKSLIEYLAHWKPQKTEVS